jgi:hypothetical protein
VEREGERMMTCAVLRLTAFNILLCLRHGVLGIGRIWAGLTLLTNTELDSLSLLFTAFLPLREPAVVYFPLSNRVETVS